MTVCDCQDSREGEHNEGVKESEQVGVGGERGEPGENVDK